MEKEGEPRAEAEAVGGARQGQGDRFRPDLEVFPPVRRRETRQCRRSHSWPSRYSTISIFLWENINLLLCSFCHAMSRGSAIIILDDDFLIGLGRRWHFHDRVTPNICLALVVALFLSRSRPGSKRRGTWQWLRMHEVGPMAMQGNLLTIIINPS